MANQNLIDIWKNLDTFYKNQISNVISTPKNITLHMTMLKHEFLSVLR